MFGVVTVKRTRVCVPGVTPPSSTLQNVAGRSSTRTTHCWPRLELTMRSGSPFRSGVLFLLSPAKTGTATARASNRIDKRFIQSPSKVWLYERGVGTASGSGIHPYGTVFCFESQLPRSGAGFLAHEWRCDSDRANDIGSKAAYRVCSPGK